MRFFLLGLAFSSLVGCSGAGIEGDDPGVEGPDAVEDTAALSSSRVYLRVPVVDEAGKPMARFNARLQGSGSFPTAIEFEGDARGAAAPGPVKRWETASVLADKVAETIDDKIVMRNYAEPVDYKTADPATTLCYKGNPKLVVPLMQDLTDSVFSDQLSVHGWRYRQMKVMADHIEGEDGFPNVWKTWRGRGDAILVLTASSDSGDEMHVAIIPKCR